MNINLTDFSALETQYVAWVRTSDKKKEIDLAIENISGKIVFCRGREIYHQFDITPTLVRNSICVVSSNNDRINELIQKVVKRDFGSTNVVYNFTNNNVYEFQILFFSNLESIENKITADDREYAHLEEPDRNCVIV